MSERFHAAEMGAELDRLDDLGCGQFSYHLDRNLSLSKVDYRAFYSSSHRARMSKS